MWAALQLQPAALRLLLQQLLHWHPLDGSSGMAPHRR
jgi:hypothetical protein